MKSILIAIGISLLVGFVLGLWVCYKITRNDRVEATMAEVRQDEPEDLTVISIVYDIDTKVIYLQYKNAQTSYMQDNICKFYLGDEQVDIGMFASYIAFISRTDRLGELKFERDPEQFNAIVKVIAPAIQIFR